MSTEYVLDTMTFEGDVYPDEHELIKAMMDVGWTTIVVGPTSVFGMNVRKETYVEIRFELEIGPAVASAVARHPRIKTLERLSVDFEHAPPEVVHTFLLQIPRGNRHVRVATKGKWTGELVAAAVNLLASGEGRVTIVGEITDDGVREIVRGCGVLGGLIGKFYARYWRGNGHDAVEEFEKLALVLAWSRWPDGDFALRAHIVNLW